MFEYLFNLVKRKIKVLLENVNERGKTWICEKWITTSKDTGWKKENFIDGELQNVAIVETVLKEGYYFDESTSWFDVSQSCHL